LIPSLTQPWVRGGERPASQPEQFRTIRYLVADTSNWIGGRHVLIAPEWVDVVRWEASVVDVQMTREAIKSSPEYPAAGEVTRGYEHGLYPHYGLAGYWAEDDSRPDADGLARLEDYDDLEVADGDADVRGWRVVASDGVTVGTVEHLIVDRPSMKVRYLEVGLESTAGPAANRDVLIPLEHADLNAPARHVRLPSLRSTDVTRLPAFGGVPIDGAHTERLQANFEAQASRARREVRPGRTAEPDPARGTGGLAAPTAGREQVVNHSSDQRNDVTRDRDPRLDDEHRH
jgi:hypothetical protein